MLRFIPAVSLAGSLAIALAVPSSALADGEQARNSGSITVMKPVNFRGKPPYRRAAVEITREETSPQQLVVTNRRVGPPGKQGAQKRRVFVENLAPVEEFARFEEDPDAKALPRRPWHGAPGKRRRLLSQ